MDLQKFIEINIAANRAKTLANSDQLTLGQMIEKLKPIVEKQKDREEEAKVRYDFEYLFPTTIDSWRGSYNELALNFEMDGKELTVTEFYNLLTASVGKVFEGYKGGDFKMSERTPVWVANYGRSGSTAVIDIIDDGYQVLIMTGYRDF